MSRPSSSTGEANSVLPALHHALSGSLGTLVSTCGLYPLSLVVARLQVQRQLRRNPKCTSPTPASSSSSSSSEEEESLPSKQADEKDRRPQPTVEDAGIIKAFSQIWNSEGGGGLKAFYTGLAQDAPKSVLDSFLFFLIYEWFRSIRLRSHRRAGYTKSRGLGVVEELAVGMAAGACSRSFTTPIANVVTRKQTATLLDPHSSLGVREIVHSIRREKGIAGFWSGYSASLVLTLNPGLTFFLQEFLKSTLADQAYDDPAPQFTFLFAASSKAISSFITYPFQIAKTRLQAGIPLEPSGSDEAQAEDTKEVKKEDKNRSKAARAVQNLVRRSIFGTIAQIVRTEGIGSLYDGVGAELVKGFFSHGTTMLAKDAIHKLLFKLYITVLGILIELRKRRAGKGMLPVSLRRTL